MRIEIYLVTTITLEEKNYLFGNKRDKEKKYLI